jgi:hypothetical protein
MRYRELLAEAKPRKPRKPLTPKQATARGERVRKAQTAVQDVANANALRIQKARERLANLP